MSIELEVNETNHSKYYNTLIVENGKIYQLINWEKDIMSEAQLYKLIETITVTEGYIPKETKNNIIIFSANSDNDIYEINLETKKVIRKKKIFKGDTSNYDEPVV